MPGCSPANPMWAHVEQPGIGTYRMPASPVDTNAVPRLPPRPAPLLGAHTEEVLADVLGLSAGEIGRLYDDRVVAGTVAGPASGAEASVRVAPGDRIGLVGRNGAGKTTLTRVLAGEAAPAAGTVTRTGSIGYLPQDPRTCLLYTSDAA